MTTYFTIPGNPVAKQRARTARTMNGVRTYTPEKTVAYETTVAWTAKKAIAKPLNGPVALSLAFFLTVPASWSKKRSQAALSGWHTSKPDADNLAKSVLDGLNGIAWADDAQVARLSVQKRYSLDPRVEVIIWGLE